MKLNLIIHGIDKLHISNYNPLSHCWSINFVFLSKVQCPFRKPEHQINALFYMPKPNKLLGLL